MEKGLEYSKYLNNLKKEDLINIINDYNILMDLYQKPKLEYKKLKKDKLVKLITDNKKEYIKCIIMSLDLKDFTILKELVSNEYLNKERDLVKYLENKKILWREDSLVIPNDLLTDIKDIIKQKEVLKEIKHNDKLYKTANGMIIAYGVVDIKKFTSIVGENNLPKLEYYYHKDYIIETKQVISNKLTNKKKISKYFKDKKYKEFSNKDFINMANCTYHHGIKAYKKFIKMLKSHYVFKNSDIEFVDSNVVIPYLYNSINEEEIASKKLEETIISLFEFKGDKLKIKILEEIKKIRNDFPLWEYRGYTKNEREVK